MFRRARKVRIYVRNKQRYDPASKTRGFLFVDVENYVGTTIADIKEDIRKQTKGAIRIDELFLNNLPLADDREKFKQPPHFPTIDDFLFYLEGSNKKGASMHPEYTQKDMRAFEREYKRDFLGKYEDPLSVFLDHHALRLGYLEPVDIDQPARHVEVQPLNNSDNNKALQNNGTQRQGRLCEDCEMTIASLYCIDCPEGIALCEPCSDRLHAGVKRRRHNLQDIRQAPKNSKQYIPRAFLAPFALTVAMYRSLTEGKLSLTEEEIKKRAQPLTDTDLLDKQNGRYVGGFDCMENTLIAKGLVKKEAARVPTYALTESGHTLGEKLYTFYVSFNSFLQQHNFPKINSSFVNKVAGNHKICLIIDEHERDKDRLLSFATDKRIDAQVRFLPAGDYVWILSPPMYDVTEQYLGNDPENEMVLPFLVERKSWEDYENTLNSARYQRQINNMLGSGLEYCFYLMEGSLSALKSNKSQHHQQHLMAQVEKLMTEYGLYVNYTSSWMKSAQWLLWFSQLLIKGCNMGLFKDDCISYLEFSSRVARQTDSSKLCTAFRNAEKCCQKWTAQFFIDHIFRDSQGGQSMIAMVKEELNVSSRKKHLLVIQDLEQYNKKRQHTLTKCCEMVCSNTQSARETVSAKIGLSIHNMVHYDISSFRQLNIQIILGVYVVRTENDEDSTKIQQKFLAGPQGPIPTLSPFKAKKELIPKKVINGKDEKQQSNTLHANILKEIPNNQTNIESLSAAGTSSHIDNVTSSKTDGSFIRIGSSPASANFRKVPVSRKSSIHTFSSTECADNVEKQVCNTKSTGLLENSANKSSTQPKTFSRTQLHMVTPFSGVGHCLGSRTDSDCLVKNSDDVHVEQKPALAETLRPEKSHGGLLGGANETVDRDFADVSIKTEDFVSFQDEEYILRKEKSQADLVTLNENEDEMVRLAVELSKKDSSGKGSEDEQLRLALERSMTETFRETDYINDNYQPTDEEELEIAIERSKRDCSHNSDRFETSKWDNNLPYDDAYQPTVEEEYELAIERSKQEFEYKAIGSKIWPICDNLSHADTSYQASADEELDMVIERSKVEISQSPYSSLKLIENKAAQFEDQRKSTVNEDHFGNFTSRPAFAHELNKYEVTDGIYKGTKRNISDVNESDITITPESRDFSEEEQLEIAIKLSKQYCIQHSKCKSNLPSLQIQSVGQDVKEQVSSSDQSMLDLENEQLRLAIERSRIENYSPRKRFKSGIEKGFNSKTDSVDKQSRKDLYEECVEVILIDSQSHEMEEDYETDHVSSKESGNSDSILCNNNKEGIVVDKKLIKSSCGTERVSLCQSTFDHSCSDVAKRCDLSTYKDNYQDPSEDSASTLLNVQNHLFDDHSVNVLHSRENICTKLKGKDLTSEDYNTEMGLDSGNDDCVLPSPDKVLKLGLNLTPPFSKRRRSLFLSGKNSSPTVVVNRTNEKDTECVKETMESRHEKSLADSDEIVADNENNDDSCEVPKKNNLLSQVFYDSSESENESSDENDGDDENEIIGGSKDCDLKRSNKDNGSIIIPGNICIISNSQEKGKSSQKEVSFKCNENKCVLNRSENYSAIYVPVDNNSCCLNEIKGEKIKAESPNDRYERLSANTKEKKTLPDFCGNHEILRARVNDSKTLSDHINDHETLNDHFNDHETLVDQDDDMVDIDFQPNSQDCDTESTGASADDSGPDLDDVETLPVIGRPRIVKYKTVKREIDRLLKEKPSKKYKKGNQEFRCSVNSIKSEKGSDNDKSTKSYNVDMDEQIARLMQSLFDNRNKNSLKVSDEDYARKLQDTLNNDAESESSTCKSINTSSDEAYAKQLDLVLNGEKKITDNDENLCSLTIIPEKVSSRTNPGSDREREIEELQRKEFEKIELWKKAIMDDEKLAKQLQQLEEMEREHAAEANSSGITSPTSSQCKTTKTETSFKKMVALHKASREKALSQLNEYRQLQMDRFRSSRNPTNSRHHTATVTSTGTISFVDDEPVKATDLNTQNSVITIDDEMPERQIDQNMTRNGLFDLPNFFHSLSSNHLKPLIKSGSHVTESDELIGKLQQPSSSHVVASDISKSEMKNSNITCGNCGEKGHNRTYIRCKKYHTAEETARREIKMEKMKQKKEEKKQMEVETLNLLTNHQQVLEEMTEQIQNEMNTIQRRLKQKTTELEKQVSHRVKKLENSKKKEKR